MVARARGLVEQECWLFVAILVTKPGGRVKGATVKWLAWVTAAAYSNMNVLEGGFALPERRSRHSVFTIAPGGYLYS